jgi:DNA-binding PadR family transcriptional regulator
MSPPDAVAMSTFEYHVLLALASGPLHGYAVKDAVAAESAGTLVPRAGSMYRVLARLMTAGLVTEARPEGAPSPHPGLARKYYALTARGRAALAAETRRLKRAVTVAERRLSAARGRP